MTRRRALRGTVAAAIILLGTAAALAAAHGGATPGEETPASGLPRPWIAAPGKVEPVSEEIKVAAAITGRLAEVRVEEGQRVAVGEILAVIDNAEHLARLHQAEAAMRLKAAALRKIIDGPRMAERREAGAAVAERQADLVQAQAENERQDALAAAGHASRQAKEHARRDRDVAQAKLAEAIHHRDVVDAVARPEDVDLAQADLEAAKARVEELRAAYERTFVRSPVAGVVLRKYRRPGEMVTENVETPIVSVGDDSVLRVRAEIDEADIAPLAINLPAYVSAPAFGTTRFAGKVSRIGSIMGRKAVFTDQPAERVDTRVLEVLIDLDPGAHLPIGLRVDAFIVPAAS